MNDQISVMKEDIAFVRAMAQEGRTSPREGGGFLVAAGVLYGATSLIQWAVAERLVSFPGDRQGVAWIVSSVLYMACVVFLLRGRARHPKTPSSRALAMAWSGLGWAIFTLVAAVVVVCWRANSPLPSLLLPSIILALYGAAWSVSAVVAPRSWTWAAAAGSYLAAVVTAWFATSPIEMLVYAAALTLLGTLPGLALMREPAPEAK